MASHIDDLLQLIESVYAAALDEGHWRNLAPAIARTFRSTSTNLQIQQLRGGQPQLLTVTENLDAAAMNSYRAYYWQRDVWVDRAIKHGMSRVLASKDIVADPEFQETEFYRDWCRRLDVFYVVGAVFPTGRNELGVIGIHRPKAAGTYQEDDKLLVSRFLPHLQRALQIRHQFAQTALLQRVSIETLNRNDTAILVVAAVGHIIFANSHAEALLADRGAVCIHKGRLAATIHSDTARLMSLIRSASDMGEASNEPGGVMALRQAHGLPLSVLVAPFRLTWQGVPPPSAIVFIRDPNGSMRATAALRALFQLTPAEARIAQALANGKSLAEIAVSRRANPETVRKQLKAIFAKTGTNRQAQCVAAILRSIAAMTRD
jgi:DNA-binding CsgD family transcriptional regulator